jgi:hypothetical protein
MIYQARSSGSLSTSRKRETRSRKSGRLFHALHPRRGEPGFRSSMEDGNGEVEEAAGDV